MLNIVAPFTSETSYGLVSLNLARELAQHIPLRLIPLGQSNFIYPELKELSTGEINQNWAGLKIFHQFDLALNCGSPRIGFPIFELDSFSQNELNHLRSCDHVITCSDWGVNVLKLHGIHAHKVCLGVDERFSPYTTNNSRHVFLHIGKVEVRKNSKIIVDLFAEEFKNDNVELWLAWHNIFARDMEEWNNYAKYKLGDKVKLVPRLTYDQLPQLIQRSDTVISLSSAEGWNLPILEAMACGKTVIATRNTAQTEFCNNQNSLLVDTPNKDWARDGVFFVEKVGKWHTIDRDARDQFKSHLRKSLSMSLNQEGIETARKFTWKNAAKQFLDLGIMN